jgi:hypothetical protein
VATSAGHLIKTIRGSAPAVDASIRRSLLGTLLP